MPTAILPTPRGPSAFLYPDPEGAPGVSGRRYHAAVDWFADGGTEVRSPVDGTLVEVRGSGGDRYGQVFGGAVKVQERGTARVFVLRHVEPRLGALVGRPVTAGERVADVTSWADRPTASHVHLEVWRTLGGGYRLGNMIDPGQLRWTPWAAAPAPGPPRPPGGTLRLVLPGHPMFVGWEGTERAKGALGPLAWIAAHGLEPDTPCLLTWQKRRYTTARQVTGVARYFASRGWLT